MINSMLQVRIVQVRPREHGFVLIATLIFLIVLSLLVLGLSNSTTSEEKMARNFRDSSVAFQAAEAALRDAELHVTGAYQWPYSIMSSNAFSSSCASGLCDSSTNVQRLDNVDFFATSGVGTNSIVIGAITGSPQIQGIATANQPRYMIETVCTSLGPLGGSSCNKVFRITAQARGRFASTRVTLQSTYAPPELAN